MHIFLDMDGVVADFDRHYAQIVGPLPDRNDPNRDVDWSRIDEEDFFATMPIIPDAYVLWHGLHEFGFRPTFLTGCPKIGFDRAARHKREWIARNFGADVGVLTCLSKEKWKHATKGDVLIDDWEKYKHDWVNAGGIWITHTDARQSLDQVQDLLVRVAA